MVTTCFTSICAETNASLCLTLNNLNCLDGIFFMRSTKVKLEVVTNFQDDASCGQDVLLECSCIFPTNAMLQFVVVVWSCFNPKVSKSICMLGCPTFSMFFASITWSPLECWSFDGDVKVAVDVYTILFNYDVAFVDHPPNHFPQYFQACIL